MKKISFLHPIISLFFALGVTKLMNTQYAFIAYVIMGVLFGITGTIFWISYREKRGVFSQKRDL